MIGTPVNPFSFRLDDPINVFRDPYKIQEKFRLPDNRNLKSLFCHNWHLHRAKRHHLFKKRSLKRPEALLAISYRNRNGY
jgi:hypothetical protein